MFPELFRIGDFVVTTFGVMMFLSFLGGAWATGRQLERYGLERELIWDMLAGIAIGGILGAKIYYLLLHLDDVVANPAGEIFSRGGLVWYGGLIGGVLAYYWQIRKRGLPVATMFDATAPALFLAIAIGRMGCFLVGDDYGVPTDGWYGVAFPRGAPPSTAGHFRSIGVEVPPGLPDNAVLTVHPTQLYEIALVLPLFALLWHLGKRAMAPGRLFALFLGLYAIERFLIEFVRAKDDRFLLGLSTSQGVSIVLVVIALVIWFRQANVPPFRADPAAEGKAASAAARR
ncbi:MAG: prolipoprotein diacylglyceryl transferase [Candidatus Cloacimonetes bacterium]|jgi:phosphatidylglycerol:prolipoprotein diacylglycerol transferase|nr:prolipoprotein diacylglyceryl transferase [Candidatus Cloacimonadota bacterium]